MKVSAGPVETLPSDRCLPVADGAALVLMTADGPRAYANQCLHLGSAMDDAWIRDGVLSCPLHFWRYDATTGQLIGGQPTASPAGQPAGSPGLASFPVEVIEGEVFVDVPEPEPPLSFRDRQLKHAEDWNRDQ